MTPKNVLNGECGKFRIDVNKLARTYKASNHLSTVSAAPHHVETPYHLATLRRLADCVQGCRPTKRATR